MTSQRRLPFALFLALVAGIQFVSTAAGADYYLIQLTMAAYYSMTVLGLTLLMGYAGQISMGHAAFFAIGGYTTAVLTTHGHSPALALVLALVLALGVAILLGLPVLRLKGHYLAMATLGFGTIVYRVLLGGRLFGEADGLSDVPPMHIAPGLVISGASEYRVVNYYFAFGLVFLSMILLTGLIRSRAGRALRALHGSEEAAAACGVDASRCKLAVFAISACFACLGGVFLTHYNGSIGPSEAGIMKSVRYVAIVAAGGMGNLWGTLFIGTLLNFMSLRGLFGSYDDAVFGVILIAIMLFAPEGVLNRGWLTQWKRSSK
ncbi:MAG: branched-chain amino acid ABC transporter permease [Fibrobacterota bacterium]